MDCWWPSPETASPAIFWCAEDIDTELISGYVSLSIEEDPIQERYFSICGKDITLNTGHNLHDTAIQTLTEYNYSCFDSYERELGNEFDWIWNETERTLQLIWRPKNDIDKALTLFIDSQLGSSHVEGKVHYKEGYFN